MILRFGAENWKSIRDYQELSLIASPLADPDDHLLTSSAVKERVLPAVAIYGANASGKSNVVDALEFLRDAVLFSNEKSKPGSGVPVRPFRLDPDWESRPTRLDIDFILDGVRMQYGVALSAEKVIEEYLYSFPERRRRVLFHRKEQDFSFGKFLSGENKTIQSVTRDNSLFVSVAATLNHEQLTRVFHFFQHSIAINDELPPFGIGEYFRYATEPELKSRIVDFLRAADVGIEGLEFEDKQDEKKRVFAEELSQLIRKHVGGENSSVENIPIEELSRVRKITLSHRGTKGNVSFGLVSESRGTQTLLHLLPPALDAIEKSQTLVVDEIDTSLHPLLARKLLGLFHSRVFNRNGAQLIFTTHDTNLLDRKLLRRDQVWFTEKDSKGATALYPLTDIRTRPRDNIQKGYLEGRFGAVPYLGDFEAMCAD